MQNLEGSRAKALAAVLLCASASCKDKPSNAPPIRVAAAADLAVAFGEIGAELEQKTGQKVVFTFGSTGLLAKQIAEGAPFDLFAAANVSYVDDVIKSGACLGDSKSLYAVGRIVLWSKMGGAGPKTLLDLKDPRFKKIAIANPEHAPYGRAAKQALVKAGLWDAVSPKLVYGENVQQTLQFATSGNAEVAIVAMSLSKTQSGDVVPVDPSLHEPLEQALVVCKGDPKAGGARVPAARELGDFIRSPRGREILDKYGFTLPNRD